MSVIVLPLMWGRGAKTVVTMEMEGGVKRRPDRSGTSKVLVGEGGEG